jgi:hypothetical protein
MGGMPHLRTVRAYAAVYSPFRCWPSGTGGRGLATGTMFNRAGQLVCTAAMEGYFGRNAPHPDSPIG